MRYQVALGVLGACVFFGDSAMALRTADPASCLPDMSAQRVLSSHLPNGALRHVAEFRLEMSLAAASSALAVRLLDVAGPGHLMRQSAGDWQTFSFWIQKRFCVVQIRSLGALQTLGLLTLTDYDAVSAKVSPRAEAPPWWPSWQAGHVERWLDAGRQVTTMTGFSTTSLSAVRARIERAAARGGLLPSAQVLAPVFAPGQRAMTGSGLMLIFRGPGRELAVTLTTVAQITGVVAHLEEH